MSAFFETYSGAMFDFEAPAAGDIRIEDVARALSQSARFGGHTSRFYSIAEHALLVHGLVCEAYDAPHLALAALHHDSHEAYLGDIPTPLKRVLGAPVAALAQEVDAAVAVAFGFAAVDFHDDRVKAADAMALRIEALELKASRGLNAYWGQSTPPPFAAPWRLGMFPRAAEAAFLDVHRQEKDRL